MKKLLILNIILFSSLKLSTQSTSNPYILSQWAGGNLGNEDFEIKYQGTYFLVNKLNLLIKNRLELGMNFLLVKDFNSSGYIKYHFNLNDHISIAPSLLIAKSYTVDFKPPDLYDLYEGLGVSPGINIHIRNKLKRAGLVLNYFYVPQKDDEHEISFLYGYETENYAYGLNFYHLTGNLTYNIELIGFKTFSRKDSSSDIDEIQLLATLSYSKNKIVSYDFGFWSRLNNQENNCEIICINFLPTLGISLDMAKAFRKKDRKI